jgi:hypothetical protein
MGHWGNYPDTQILWVQVQSNHDDTNNSIYHKKCYQDYRRGRLYHIVYKTYQCMKDISRVCKDYVYIILYYIQRYQSKTNDIFFCTFDNQ